MAGWAIMSRNEVSRETFPTDSRKPIPFLVRENRKRNDILFFEGDRSTHLIRIHDGFVKLLKHGASGKDAIVGIYGPGDVLGEITLFDNGPHNFTAVAMTPVVISREAYEKVLMNAGKDPQMIVNLARTLAERLRETQDNMQFIATERVEKRIANLLIRLSEGRNNGHERTLKIPLMRREVADMVGATIETTIRILSRFIQDGAVKKTGRKLMIADLDYLKEVLQN